MEGIKGITHKLQSDAEQKAAAIKSEAEKEAASYLEQEKIKTDQEVELLLKEAEQEAQDAYNRMKSMAELEFRKRRLAARQQAVDEVFDMTLNKIRRMHPERYFKILVNMVVAASVTGKEKIILSDTDKKQLPANFLKLVHQMLETKGLPGGIELSEEKRTISGGFILVSEFTELNYAFESILRMNRDEYEVEAAEGLFGKAGTGVGA
jgi:V/A-type H+-transporting ATPase subunit E